MPNRLARSVSAAVANGAALSGIIDNTWGAAGGLKAPAALEATTVIGFKVAESQDGTFLPLHDASGTLVEVAVDAAAAKAYALPDELFPWPYFKLWTEAAGADVLQTAERAFGVVFKD